MPEIAIFSPQKRLKKHVFCLKIVQKEAKIALQTSKIGPKNGIFIGFQYKTIAKWYALFTLSLSINRLYPLKLIPYKSFHCGVFRQT
jgi:hypothetical protein